MEYVKKNDKTRNAKRERQKKKIKGRFGKDKCPFWRVNNQGVRS